MKDYIIGIDHGNGYMKTVGSVFISGFEHVCGKNADA